MTKYILISAISILLFSCTGEKEKSFPRRYAYPRIELYADSTKTVTLPSSTFNINAAATVESPRPEWLDISYPRYGAVLHISENTLATPAQLDEAIANRRQRIALNLGDTEAESLEYTTPNGFSILQIKALDASGTPVQFIAVKDLTLISGAFVFTHQSTNLDSISPIITALNTEASTIANSLNTCIIR